jgi:pyrroline-5-carboxylate reductase
MADCCPAAAAAAAAGVHELEKGGMRAAMINAVVAATNRANELSRMS